MIEGLSMMVVPVMPVIKVISVTCVGSSYSDIAAAITRSASVTTAVSISASIATVSESDSTIAACSTTYCYRSNTTERAECLACGGGYQKQAENYQSG